MGVSLSDPVINPPQPVLRNATVTALVLFVLMKVALLTKYMGWWDPDADLLVLIAEFVGDMAAVVVFVQAWWSHNQVMPVEKAAALIATAQAEPVVGPMGMWPTGVMPRQGDDTAGTVDLHAG